MSPVPLSTRPLFDATLVEQGRRALLAMLLSGKPFVTADDIRRVVQLPPGSNPKRFGLVPKPLEQAGIIRSTGFVQTRRPVAHGRWVHRWVLEDRDKAVAYLRAADRSEKLAA